MTSPIRPVQSTAPTHPVQRSVTVGRHRLRIAVREGTGQGTAPPLLLCSGIGVSIELWEPLVAALDPDRTIVMFDVPGVGGSPLPALPLRMPLLARLAGQLLDQFGHDRFDVLGVSWGGALAQQLAFQNPRRCRRVVLVATATGSLMVPGAPSVLLRMATPRRHRDPAYALAIAGDIYGGRLRTQPELVQQLLLAHDRPASGRGYLYQLAAAAGWTSLPFLPLIRQPTLVLAGADDPIIPLVNARVMAKLLPAARLHVYDDGHLGILTMADELGPMVSGFLSETDSAAGGC